MAILIGCERSGIVRDAFAQAGHAAYSNDLLPSRAAQSRHIQGDVFAAIRTKKRWDLIILHPPCTALACSGNRWYGEGGRAEPVRDTAIAWTLRLYNAARNHAERVALENPIGVLSRHLGKPDQIIQPWQYGHPEWKATCLWLYGLPLLTATAVMPPPYAARIWRMAPGPDRQERRSETYHGIAQAMATQWGRCIL